MRLRQVALVARDLEAAVSRLRETLGPGEPYRDPDVAIFGLRNAVFTIGDQFLEVVSPVRESTAAGRHLERLGGDGGYMAIFQVDDFAAARARVEHLGVRIAWEVELDDISAMHLHPADVPGAIVSLDEPRPPGSWRWAGDWTPGTGGLRSITVEAPEGTRQRWAEVLGEDPPGVRFVPGDRGIVEVTVERDGRVRTLRP
jgi:catechol 2,3-dioxygenase-like lactoylglutathione lyase family enzyme